MINISILEEVVKDQLEYFRRKDAGVIRYPPIKSEGDKP
jgi:hypothetical protein